MIEESAEARAAREASEWLARLNSRAVSTEDLNAFYDWRRDPVHAEAYARGEALWHEARKLGDDRDIAQAVREALERPRVAESRRYGRRAVLAGGGLAAIIAAGGAWRAFGRGTRYRTDVGEQLLVRLEDGSRMRLNTDSAAQVWLTGTRRDVRLERGQALFEVVHQPGRPFTVQSRDFTVEALGTRFEVAAIGDRPARVLLVEGRIAVDAPGAERMLEQPGDRLTLAPGRPPVAERVDTALATSWTSGRLAFRRTPIAAAIEEVNRYSRTQIEFDAPDQSDVEIDGEFEAGDPDAFLAAITALFPLRARRVASDRILLTDA